jgi:hypothetical protein
MEELYHDPINGGYVLALANCGQCGALFGFNPNKVPSVNNIPFCKTCVDAANPMRVRNGLKPIEYAIDAYGPIHESELRC